MNTGYMQGRSETIRLPAGGYFAGVQNAGMGPYGGHDPYLNGANPYAQGASQAGALGVGGPTGYGGVGGVMGGSLSAMGIAGSFQGAYNNARNDNLDRYASIDKGYADRAVRGNAILESMQAATTAGLDQEWKQQGIQALAPFKKNLGPNRSSVTAQISRNTAEGKSIAMAKAQAELARLKLQGLDLYKDRLDFQERRNDTYPDANRMDRLLSAGGDADGGGPGAPANPAGATPGMTTLNPNGPVMRRNVGPSLGQLRNQKKAANAALAATGVAVPGLIKGALGAGMGRVNGLLNNIFTKPYMGQRLPASTASNAVPGMIA